MIELYRVVNPNAILSFVRSMSGVPAYMYDSILVFVITDKRKLPKIDKLNEEFRKRFGYDLIDVVDSIKIEKLW